MESRGVEGAVFGSASASVRRHASDALPNTSEILHLAQCNDNDSDDTPERQDSHPGRC